jgi:hypothetical protein
MLQAVAKHYVMGGLAFDLLTSIPISYFDLVALEECDERDMASDHRTLRFARILKPLRLLK